MDSYNSFDDSCFNFNFCWNNFWYKNLEKKKMKTKWIVVIILSFVGIFLFSSGRAPLIFSEVVYGCNLQDMLATGDVEHVSNHPITNAYYEKYEATSTSTSGSRSLEWGHGIVEYSSFHHMSYDDGWSNAYLKVTVDQCGIPKEFEFQCMDNQKQMLISLNSKNDDLLEYLQTENCFEVQNEN